MRNLLRLGFEVLVPLVCQNEVEDGDTAFDEIKFAGAAIAKILFVDQAVQPAREEMVNCSALRKALDAGMFLPLELAPEDRGALTPMGAMKREELSRPKITGMGRYDVQEARFGLRRFSSTRR